MLKSREKTLEDGVVDARPRNRTLPALLLLLRDRSSYGYELTERLSALGLEEINISTVYRTLHQMRKKGMVSVDKTKGYGPERRMYSVMEAGEAYLESWIDSLERHQKIIEMFLRTYAQGNNGGLFGSEVDYYERENADG